MSRRFRALSAVALLLASCEEAVPNDVADIGDTAAALPAEQAPPVNASSCPWSTWSSAYTSSSISTATTSFLYRPSNAGTHYVVYQGTSGTTGDSGRVGVLRKYWRRYGAASWNYFGDEVVYTWSRRSDGLYAGDAFIEFRLEFDPDNRAGLWYKTCTD